MGLAQSPGATYAYTTTGMTSEEREAQGEGPALSNTAWSGAPAVQGVPTPPTLQAHPPPSESGNGPWTFLGSKFATKSSWPINLALWTSEM